MKTVVAAAAAVVESEFVEVVAVAAIVVVVVAVVATVAVVIVVVVAAAVVIVAVAVAVDSGLVGIDAAGAEPVETAVVGAWVVSAGLAELAGLADWQRRPSWAPVATDGPISPLADWCCKS